jgi:KDO2-lipid IV(A) lauroyltransferase
MGKKTFLKRRRNDFIYALLLTLFIFAKIVPRKIGLFVFGMVGRLFYPLLPLEKERTIQNLTLIFGNRWDTKKIHAMARTVYENLGKNIFDAIYLSCCPNAVFQKIVQHNDLAALDRAYHQGKGVIVMGGHLGCFEMMASVTANRSFNCVTIGQRLFDPRIDALSKKMRNRDRITYLHRDGSGRDIVRLLLKGYAFGVLIDQDVDLEGVFARFLGLPAFTPSSPMRIAMKYHIPVFVVHTARQADNTHAIVFEGPLELDSAGDFSRDLVANIQKVNDILSGAIMENPDQWVWMHRRWRKKPAGEEFASGNK